MPAPTDLDELVEFLGWRRPAWHRDAACREHPELSWHPTQGSDQRRQKAICAKCLVRDECAAAGKGEFGIWGGMTERARMRVRVASRLAA